MIRVMGMSPGDYLRSRETVENGVGFAGAADGVDRDDDGGSRNRGIS